MKLQIHREPSTDEGTFGNALLLDDEDQIIGRYESLELPWRDNQHGISCILPGLYEAHLIASHHFGRKVYLLENVPGRSSIELHVANWGGDKSLGWHSDLRGCMALGLGRAHMTPPDTGRSQAAITSSTDALDEVIKLAGDHLEIEMALSSKNRDYNASTLQKKH